MMQRVAGELARRESTQDTASKLAGYKKACVGWLAKKETAAVIDTTAVFKFRNY